MAARARASLEEFAGKVHRSMTRAMGDGHGAWRLEKAGVPACADSRLPATADCRVPCADCRPARETESREW